jgi:predicted DCC family thiol-disulfide oxidoreductase YuxK
LSRTFPAADAAEDRWALLYDGQCGFCKWVAAGLLRWDRAHKLRPVAIQSEAGDAVLGDLGPAERLASWHLVAPDGTRSSGGAGLPVALRLLPGGWLPARVLEATPDAAERGYRWVAAHRTQISRWVPSQAKRRAGEYIAARER